MARHDHPVFGSIRVEHYDNALRMGQHAARSMLGDKRPFDDPHWFWSDQYDANIQFAGLAPTVEGSWDDVVIRGDLGERSFVAFSLQEERIVAAVAVNRGRDVRRSMAMIKARAVVDRVRLADPDSDVRSAAAAG